MICIITTWYVYMFI